MHSQSVELRAYGAFFDAKSSTSYAPYTGTVKPYCEYALPEQLRRPLVQSSEGTMHGFVSGNRSSILQIDKVWFKKKGDKPTPGVFWPSGGQPFGGMSRYAAVCDLNATALIDERMRWFDYHGALRPAALVEYKRTLRKPLAYSAIFEINGDTRLSNVVARLVKANRDGLLIEQEFRTELTKNIASWLGFTHRVLTESHVFPTPPASYSLSNYAVYRLDEGLGISRMDFENFKNEPLPEQTALFDVVLNEVRGANAAFFASDKSLSKSGTSLKDLARSIENGAPLPDGRIGEEIRQGLESGFTNAYEDSFTGRLIPKPIPMELIRRVFDTVALPGVRESF